MSPFRRFLFVRHTSVRRTSLLALFLIGCGTAETGDLPDSITVGVLPFDAPEVLRARFEPLVRFLSAESGIDMELHIAESYESLVASFGRREVLLAYFGSVTFLEANSKFGAVPLVMQQLDSRFTTVLVTPADQPITDLNELRGLRIAFVSRLSTSGHVMPRFFLANASVRVEEGVFSEVTYTGSHEATVRAVEEGLVDAGFAEHFTVREMFADGRLDRAQVRISWESPPYVNNVWAIDSDLDETLRLRLREAFLELAPGHPEHDEILAAQGAQGFVPVAISDLDPIRAAILEAGIVLGAAEESR